MIETTHLNGKRLKSGRGADIRACPTHWTMVGAWTWTLWKGDSRKKKNTEQHPDGDPRSLGHQAVVTILLERVRATGVEARRVPTEIAHVSERLIARFYELTVRELSKLHLATRMVTSSLKLSPQNSAAAL